VTDDVESKDLKRADKKRDSTIAWSEKLEQKATREVKRTKREAKREFERGTKMTDAERAHQVETKKMIEQIRQQQLRSDGEDGEFEGFD